jgi:hypothetical protein
MRVQTDLKVCQSLAAAGSFLFLHGITQPARREQRALSRSSCGLIVPAPCPSCQLLLACLRKTCWSSRTVRLPDRLAQRPYPCFLCRLTSYIAIEVNYVCYNVIVRGLVPPYWHL